jgi:hypothetical protein
LEEPKPIVEVKKQEKEVLPAVQKEEVVKIEPHKQEVA